MRTLAAALLLGLAQAGAAPVISEIMFHPPHENGGEDPGDEWIEIHNDYGGKEVKPEAYLFLFLKFISCIIPTIEYDHTIAVDGA